MVEVFFPQVVEQLVEVPEILVGIVEVAPQRLSPNGIGEDESEVASRRGAGRRQCSRVLYDR